MDFVATTELVTSSADDCNTLKMGLSSKTIWKQQEVQNAAVRLLLSA